MFVPEKKIGFPETTRSFKNEWLLFFPWLFYFSNEDASYCLPCVLFGHHCTTQIYRIKSLFSQRFRYCFLLHRSLWKQNWKKKIYPSHEYVQCLHFSTWFKLEYFFSNQRLKFMKLICYVAENVNTRSKKTVKY